MLLTVNGESAEVREGSCVAELLEQFQIKPDRVAVEVNLDIIPKASYGSHVLNAGDRVEIVQFVGGG